ncbi:CotY/CotZ family spore coat protein [Niallia sp. Krafla_26]|uniref:CotY/CotZ family spore coat protein n=1 Tax=Niallia sp. Krafla_26 TaxID=3064703 RepID=UPI003D16AB47
MGCGKNGNDVLGTSHENCICEVVRAIKDIQDTVMEEESCECPKNCFLEPLGSLVSPATNHPPADTRVFVLKTADGSPFHAFFKSSDCNCVSIFFRVEDIFDNCCATLRVLRPMKNKHDSLDLVKNCCVDLAAFCDLKGFQATDDCITVDLSCFCAIQCITDCYLGICE